MPTQGAPSFDDKVLGREKTLADKGPDPEKRRQGNACKKQSVKNLLFKAFL